MRSDIRRLSAVGAVLLVPVVFVPGVAVGSVDPSVVVDNPLFRAVAAFLLVLPFGGVVLGRYGGLVDRSVDASMDSPFLSIVYGVMAHLMLIFAGGVFSMQLASAGLDPTVLSVGRVAVFGVVFLGLAGLGFAVIGMWLTERRVGKRPWHGLVAVAAVGAAGWLLPLLVGIVLWVLIVSVGLGGPTRRWIHSERTVESESDG